MKKKKKWEQLGGESCQPHFWGEDGDECVLSRDESALVVFQSHYYISSSHFLPLLLC